MQREEVDVGAARKVGEGLASLADSGCPGEEDQDVAGGSLGLAVDPPHRPRHPVLQPLVACRLLGREVLHRHLEAASQGAEPRRAEEAGHRLGVEGGGHDHEAQVLAGGLLQPPQEGQGEVSLEVALVELVEDDGADAGEGGPLEEAPGEEPSVR